MNQPQPWRDASAASPRDAELESWRTDAETWIREVERIHDEIEQLLGFVESGFAGHERDVRTSAAGTAPADVRSALRERGWVHEPPLDQNAARDTPPGRSRLREQHQRLRDLHAALQRSALRFTAALEVAR